MAGGQQKVENRLILELSCKGKKEITEAKN